MAYGNLNVDVVQSSTAGTPTQFNDGNGTQVGTLCRAWVNFNGTTSPGTIRASFNVTSVTKNATGDYTVNFTNALADANYSTVVTSRYVSGAISYPLLYASSAPTTTAVRVVNQTYNSSGYTDTDYYNVAVFR